MLYLLLRAMTDWLDTRGLYGYFGLLDQVEFRALSAAGLSFAIVLLLGRRVISWLVRMKIGDSGLSDAALLEQQTRSKANTPTMGGILIAGAILASVILLADISTFYVQVSIIIMLAFAALGAADDWLKLTIARRNRSRQGLHAWEKLVFQIGLAALVGFFLYRHNDTPAVHDLGHVLNLPFQRTYVPRPWLDWAQGVPPTLNDGLIYLSIGAFMLLSILVITGMSNAANITDGMDGLAAGVSAIISIGLFVLCLIAQSATLAPYLLVPRIPGAGELAVLSAAMAGACFGFLWWNCSPAAVFMGDTGSLCLGGLIAYVAIVLRQEIVVLLMSAVFLIEAGSSLLQVGYFKATRGKRIFKCAPFHHHLHLSNWTEQQIVVRAWIVTILLLVVALATVKVR
jgi:phospho-N-acetylmuramoyl-pentapeptide-transferase